MYSSILLTGLCSEKGLCYRAVHATAAAVLSPLRLLQLCGTAALQNYVKNVQDSKILDKAAKSVFL